MYKVKGGFSCDRQSKYDFTASTVNYIKNAFSGKDITIIFKEFDKDDNLIDFDSDDASETSKSDLVMYFNNIPYLIELKERWGQYHSNYYGKDDDKEGWFLNIEKYKTLISSSIGIPIFANLFPDNIVRIWNLNKIFKFHTLTKNIAKTNVVESDVIPQQRYDLYNRDSKTLERIKGTKSNGIWKSKGLA